MDFGFAIHKVEDTIAALTVGATVDGAIAHAGQQSRYTFDLANARRLYFDNLTNDPLQNLTWSLIGPRGEEVSARYFNYSDGSYFSSNPVLDLSAGSYTLVVDGNLDTTGPYSFRLLDVATAVPVVSGTPVSGTLPTGTETALYHFDAQAGEKIFFDQQNSSGGTVYWRLIDPFGRQVWFNGFGDQDVQALAFTGTYTLAIEGYVYGSGPASYTFSIFHVPVSAPIPIPNQEAVPAPDLEVTDIVVSPATGWLPGSSVGLTWNIRNIGNLAVSGSWTEQIRVRNLSTGQIIRLDSIAFDTGVEGLAPGESHPRQYSFVWPSGLVGSGEFIFEIATDSANQVSEGNALGTAESNNTAQVAIASAPDLKILDLHVTNAEVQAGGPLTIEWSDANTGALPVATGWFTQIAIVNTATGETVVNTAVFYDPTAPGNAPLGAGQTRPRSVTLQLPHGLRGAGTLEIHVTADSNQNGIGAIIEAAEGVDAEANNSAVLEVISQPRLYADLEASNVSAPSSGQGGGTVTVGWTVTNIGPVDTGVSSWKDTIILSRDSVWGNEDDVEVASFTRTGALAPDASYTRQETVALPQRLDGTFLLTVRTDAAGAVTEPDTLSNNVAVPVTIDLQSPAADLVVEVVVGPLTGRSGELIDLSWRVRNQGEATDVTVWTDRIVLSADEVVDATDRILANVVHSGALAKDGTYAGRATVRLPDGLQGSFHLLVITDAEARVYERDATANNIGQSLTTMAVSAAPAADLVVTGVVAPASGVPGQHQTVTWTVRNDGEGGARAPWTDRVYLSKDGTLATAIVIGEVRRVFDLAVGTSYVGTVDVTLPDAADDTYQILVVTDASQEVYEVDRESNNALGSTLALSHPDLTPSNVQAPATIVSGSVMQVRWNVRNNGTGAALSSWTDAIYLSRDDVIDAEDIKLADVPHVGGLDIDGEYLGEAIVTVPLSASGDYKLIVVADQLDTVREPQAEANNLASSSLDVTLAPYADLSVGSVTAPALTVGDPARVTIGWTVTNQGTGVGQTLAWTDTILGSRDDILGNSDDMVLAEFRHDGAVAVGGSYDRSEQIMLPAALSERFTLFVRTDSKSEVFENGSEANNAATPGHPVDVVPIPYADLTVTDLVADASAQSGGRLNVSWTVKNQGIGVTDRDQWTDTVTLIDASGQAVADARFDHLGILANDASYTRSAQIVLPNGLSGPYRLVATTGGVYEFVFTDNNARTSDTIEVTLAPSPDLTVTDVKVPASAIEGDTIDVSWTVTNTGQGVANGTWSDRIVLRPLAGTNLPDLQVGTFTFSGELTSGKSYTRTEQFRLPDKIEGLYRAFVVTNALLPTTDEATLPEPSYFLYEHGAAATNNNTGDDGTLAVQLKPRADLQVETAVVPARVPAGGTASIKFTIINQGTVPTTSRWKDSVYLSLDNQIDAGDMLVGTYDNLLALDPGGRYTKETGPIEIPIRFRRDAYLVVRTDSTDQVEEYPNDANNTRAFAFFVEPEPLSDLVTGSVVAPVQAVAGSQIEVRFTVTNKGSSSTNKDTWSDSVWLTKDRTRPSPSKNGGILLGSIQHSGALPIGQSYDQVLKVTLPDNLASGTYFITPWSDAYDVVLEDTLAVNVNPDDPNEFDNNNYKARQIQVLGPETITHRPDLKVLSVSGPTQIDAAGQYTVKWTVGNAGPGDTGDVGWVERIWISDRPTLGDVGAKEWLLESFDRSGGLAVGETATGERTYNLSPAIQGHFLIVDVDAVGAVPETNELNNDLVVASEVIRHPADLRVTRIEVPAQNFSGEKTTINWTVTNAGADVWPDTAYWIDSVFFSRDPVWNPDIQISSAAITPQRTQLLATSVHSNQGGLRAGESYNASAEVVLPPGIDGPFYVFVLTDVVPTGKAPKEEFDEAKGGDDQIREYYLESVFEGANNTNNISRQDISVTYREPDLQVSSLAVPATAISGDRVTVSWHVLNAGTRETRQDAWVDRVFLSRDGSLDTGDYELGSFQHNGKLAIGAAYTALLDVDLPEFIDGDFHIIVETDARSQRATTSLAPSTIAADLPGLQIASDVVPEFQGEGNNATGKPLPITLRIPPDLKVSSVSAPQHVTAGQPFDFSFTVLNAGSGDVRASQDSWTDLVYLSRDQHLDLESDRFVGAYQHTGGLAAGQSYTVAKSIRAPVGLEGSYYLFVVTDPLSATGRSSVFEANLETNNAKSSDQPLIFELPPPSDLVVDNNVVTPSVATVGDTLQISWTVRNQGANPAEGTWTDGVYLSEDAIWDINDRLLKLVPFTGSLLTNDTYTVSIPADLPPAKAGQYRLIVRSDIYNEVYEGPFNAESEKNNAAPSVNTLSVSVDEMHLGVPLQTTLSTGQVRVYRITVSQGETLKVRLTGSDSNASNELFLRYGDVPTGFLFDAIYQDPLQATQTAVIPATKAGEYYVLIRGHQEPSEDTAVTLLAEVAPFAISRVEVDRGGDSRWVTFDVFGAKFATNAIVKLVRPGIAEYEPVRYEVLDSTHIKATFDFTDAPHGLYDVKVINPDGTAAIEPYRYLIERALEPDVTIGLGGPRVLLAGDTGTYGIAFQSLTNVDTPYVHFSYGIPELQTNSVIYNLPYVTFQTNLRGGTQPQSGEDVPWASLESEANTSGTILAPGYLYDMPAGAFTGLSFNVSTYPGLREMNDRAWEEFKQRVYAEIPALAGTLDAGPTALDQIYPGLYDLYRQLGAIPDECREPFIPFRFNVVAAATPMTRDEFVAEQKAEAANLRTRVLADPTANAVLINLAADAKTWEASYLGALELAGILRPVDEAPPINQDPVVQSVLSVLTTGVLYGAAGEEVRSDGNLVSFFEQIHKWYGDQPGTLAPIDHVEIRQNDCYYLEVPVPALSKYSDFDLGLSQRTYFENFNVFVPWIRFEQRGAGGSTVALPEFGSLAGSSELSPLDFSRYYQRAAAVGELASITGPQGVGNEQFLPAGAALPYSVRFENPQNASARPGEIRIVTKLDSDLDPYSFRLGDLKIGDINVHIPEGRSLFQGDFDFTRSKGFILRVSAGIDISAATATWLLQAIDPETGEVIQDTSRGLLPANNAQGAGQGTVSYTIRPKDDVPTGTAITAQARVLFNTMAPQETIKLTQTLDAAAPKSTLTAKLIQGANYEVRWTATDDAGGSGVKHVTVYVAKDGGDFQIWQRQTTETVGIFHGETGHSYEFLALATDNAGNTEEPPLGILAPDDGSGPDLGNLPNVGGTSQD
ncbi:CARDB domain-containing protein, partial [Mesorhizobium sp. M7A.F.Ca.CA.001.09.1.1]|uniref:CARDB domain-containing protein n=1 Tax=Mesorhizobium sp. M7A.F.Ca.CA.001.09.1.1 TaxID=2496718 RepID=UPI000FD2667A